MSVETSKPLFFGMDLIAIYRDLKAAWAGMLSWPIFAWLIPAVDVRLHLPSGATALANGINGAVLADVKRSQTARYSAVVLSDGAFLRRSLQLPNLRATEIQAAIAMDVKAVSPFPAEECLWAYHLSAGGAGIKQVDLVISSRKVVDKYLQSCGPIGVSSEVWVPRVGGVGFLALPEYGTGARAKGEGLWRWATVLVVMVALALLACIAITPTAQLYIRALEANAAWAALQPKVAPLIDEREAFMKNADQLERLDKIIGHPMPTLEVLKIVTDGLPDDTSLTSIRIQDSRLTMVGQTPNTAALMQHLGAVAGLKDVKSPVPAVKPLGAARESFTIEAVIASAKVPPKP